MSTILTSPLMAVTPIAIGTAMAIAGIVTLNTFDLITVLNYTTRHWHANVGSFIPLEYYYASDRHVYWEWVCGPFSTDFTPDIDNRQGLLYLASIWSCTVALKLKGSKLS